jgi:arylformamidase
MTAITIKSKTYTIDLDSPIPLSMEWHADGTRAWFVDRMRIAPVLLPYVTGSVQLGGNVNFNAVEFNPHGHGTHTETVGHISPQDHPISAVKWPFFMTAQLISITPDVVAEKSGWNDKGDRFISLTQIQEALHHNRPKALVVRTLPNERKKLETNYSGTNFCYFEPAALAWLAEIGVDHILVDLPSVDREEDGGLLLAHRAFWCFPDNTRNQATITELIFVPDQAADGLYLLNLTVMPLRNDAAPSQPVLFACTNS